MSTINSIKNIFKKPSSFISEMMRYVKSNTAEVELFYDYNEVWMNTLYPKDERFMMARGAIRYRDRIIYNLRLQFNEDQQKKTIEKMCLEIAHLKANNKDLTDRCAFLRQREDLPVDRIPAYKRLIELQEINALLKVDKADKVSIVDIKEGWIISGPIVDNTPDVIVMKKEDVRKIIGLMTDKGLYADPEDYTATKIQLSYKYHPDSIIKDLNI